VKYKDTNVSELIGKTLTSIEGAKEYNNCIIFTCEDGSKYEMSHVQDCCEQVDIKQIDGDIEDLIGQPIIMAECITECARCEENNRCYGTFTFYKFATNKGYVTIQWLGESNGYYSEEVEFWLLI
jgi:hypothetical protein